MSEHDAADDRRRALARLLAAAARAHHEATGGPNNDWPRWYATHMDGEIRDLLGAAADVETVALWLKEADDRYRSLQPDAKWPTAYAGWLLEWAES